MGNTFGHKGDTKRQRAILLDALNMLTTCTTPGELVDLPYVWDEPFSFRPKKRDPSYQAGG